MDGKVAVLEILDQHLKGSGPCEEGLIGGKAYDDMTADGNEDLEYLGNV